MEALDLSIKIFLGMASIKENNENKGVFIKDRMIYEYLDDPDPDPDTANTEPIEEEALIME